MKNDDVASRAEVDALKQRWLINPSFELQAIPSSQISLRFLPYKEELKAFQEEIELIWAQQAALYQRHSSQTISDSPLDTTYRRVMAEEALRRYLNLSLPALPELVREDLADLITTLVETAVQFTIAEHQTASIKATKADRSESI